MADYQDIAVRKEQASDILRIYPNALVQIYETGTDTLVTEVIADEYGVWSINTLETGIYDIKIDGRLRKTFHFVKADHIHEPDQSWIFSKLEAVSGDSHESSSMQIYSSDVAGNIEKIIITVQSIDATGDMTIHLLRGSSNGASALQFPADSVWNHRINPGSAYNRFVYVDNNPGVEIAVNQALTLGIDYTAGTIAGINVITIFRPE